MNTLTARGFLVILLDNAQLEKLWRMELSLPRCLEPWEIGRWMGIEAGKQEESTIEKMFQLEKGFSSMLWKAREIEWLKIQEAKDKKLPISPEQVMSPQQETHRWDDYVLSHWSAPAIKNVRDVYA